MSAAQPPSPMNNPSQTKDMNELNKIDEAISSLPPCLFEIPDDEEYAKGLAGQIRAVRITQDTRKAIKALITEQVRLGSTRDGRDAAPRNPANLDELKYKADKLLHDVFYKGLNAGEDTVLQYQFERELGYKQRYIERCIKEARNELVDLLAGVVGSRNPTHPKDTTLLEGEKQ